MKDHTGGNSAPFFLWRFEYSSCCYILNKKWLSDKKYLSTKSIKHDYIFLDNFVLPHANKFTYILRSCHEVSVIKHPMTSVWQMNHKQHTFGNCSIVVLLTAMTAVVFAIPQQALASRYHDLLLRQVLSPFFCQYNLSWSLLSLRQSDHVVSKQRAWVWSCLTATQKVFNIKKGCK